MKAWCLVTVLLAGCAEPKRESFDDDFLNHEPHIDQSVSSEEHMGFSKFSFTMTAANTIELPEPHTTAIMPYAEGANYDTRCIIVFTRDQKRGLVVDRETLRTEPFDQPAWFVVDGPKWCDERVKPGA